MRSCAIVADVGHGRSEPESGATPSRGFRARLERLMAVPVTDSERARTVVGTFVLHLRPVRVPEATIRFTHTFGLGGTSLVLLGVLALTGSLLMLGYTPVPGDAYASIERLQEEVLFGAFVRAVHHWSANLLVLVAALHLLRVFLTGGFLDGRELNWVVGLVLLGAIAASAFTGYLLPWDQLAFWAVTIVTGMAAYVPLAGPALASLLRGGEEIGPATLGTYYALHTQWLPVLLFAGAGFHFWRVRKAGGVVVPPDAVRDEKGKPEQVLFLPHLLWRETAVALRPPRRGVTLFSALVRAPLGPAANPGLSLNPAKAPWYFLGFQELLVHLHPLFAVVVVPLLGAIALVALPWLGLPEGRTARGLVPLGDRAADGAARGPGRSRRDAPPRPRRRGDPRRVGTSVGGRRAPDPRGSPDGGPPRGVRRVLPVRAFPLRRLAPRGDAGSLRLPRGRLRRPDRDGNLVPRGGNEAGVAVERVTPPVASGAPPSAAPSSGSPGSVSASRRSGRPRGSSPRS